MSEDDARTELAELPDEVRLRVLSLTADVLGQVPTLPAPLRKVADFAPARRARLGATAIGAALATDDFRERVAVQVEARLPTPRGESTEVAADRDPVEAAARAWLVRPEGWQAVLGEVDETLAARAGAPAQDRDRTGGGRRPRPRSRPRATRAPGTAPSWPT